MGVVVVKYYNTIEGGYGSGRVGLPSYSIRPLLCPHRLTEEIALYKGRAPSTRRGALHSNLEAAGWIASEIALRLAGETKWLGGTLRLQSPVRALYGQVEGSNGGRSETRGQRRGPD